MLRQMMRNAKYARAHLCGIGALAVILAALVLRVVFVTLGWPFNNSDEGTMDLMALHIFMRGEHPIFYYGQHYMGSMEAYIGAGLFWLLGPSVLAMRLGMIALFGLFLLCIYFLTSLLYTRRLALFSVFLLSLGSSSVLRRQLEAIGGYPEIVFLGALLFLLAAYMAFTTEAYKHRGWRIALFALWGLVAGFSLWTDFLIAPCLVASGLVLLVFCWKELLLKGRALALLLGGGVGGWPLIYYNLNALPGQDSISVFLNSSKAGAQNAAQISLLQQFVGTFFFGIPNTTGGVLLRCPIRSFPLFGQVQAETVFCSLGQGGWGLGYLVLWMVGVALAIGALWKLSRDAAHRNMQSFEEKQASVRQFTRLMLLVSAGLTIVLYLRTPAPVTQPVDNARYLICILISTPALLWPLWQSAGKLSYDRRWRQRVSALLSISLLLLISITLLTRTAAVFKAIPDAQENFRQQHALAVGLLHMGATRIYTDYWTGNRLIFESHEQIIASDVKPDLTRYPDRYSPYTDIVRSAAHPVYVFCADCPQASALERYLISAKIPFQRVPLTNYLVYKPAKPIPIPL